MVSFPCFSFWLSCVLPHWNHSLSLAWITLCLALRFIGWRELLPVGLHCFAKVYDCVAQRQKCPEIGNIIQTRLSQRVPFHQFIPHFGTVLWEGLRCFHRWCSYVKSLCETSLCDHCSEQLGLLKLEKLVSPIAYCLLLHLTVTKQINCKTERKGIVLVNPRPCGSHPHKLY